MTNVVSIQTRRALTGRGLTTTASVIQPGSNRAGFVERVLHAARAKKAEFGVGDKVAAKRDPNLIGTVQEVHQADTVRYVVSFSGIRRSFAQRELEKAGA